jgi:pyruvate,orthophosphate dikinase
MDIAVASFVRDIADPEVEDATSYGGKASGLARMAKAGIPVPPAFAIGTAGFRHFRSNSGRVGDEFMATVHDFMRRLEVSSGKTFGGVERPLLVSVRSGAAISMPGMMDTILNLGLTSASAFALAASGKGPEFALDTWLRFWRMFCDTVLDLDPAELTDAITEQEERARRDVTLDSFQALESAVLAHIASNGETASGEPSRQLEQTIAAVFRSWDSARAKAYRRHHGISDDLGTSVTVQAMVFGNADENSGSGVAFTRNPNHGDKALYGEYLIGRQGEDLVSGSHTPIDLSDPAGMDKGLRESLSAIGGRLEALYRDAVDLEFTVEAGKLFLLQVRPAKRTAAAAIRIAEDLVAEGLISAGEALKRISIDHVKKVSRPAFEEADLASARLIARGLGSSPGQASGAAILDADRAAERASEGEVTILLRPTTSPQDIRGMLSARGVVTAKGGALSHAAVVSRALDKPCIVGCETIEFDLEARTFTIDGKLYREGDKVSIDGGTGKVFAGEINLRPAGSKTASLQRILAWADASSGSMVWSAARSEAELDDSLKGELPGVGVVGLTDLVIASGRIDKFVELISLIGSGKAPVSASDALSDIVLAACRPVIAAALGVPLHIRLSRVSSDRARRLIENWTELPPNLFLPLGAPSYLRSVLAGLSAAANEARHRQVTGLIGGIVGSPEFDSFLRETEVFGDLSAGAMIQNAVTLHAAADLARRGVTLWIDLAETIRTAHGFPTEIQQADSALDDYAASGNLVADPFVYRNQFYHVILVADLVKQYKYEVNACSARDGSP